MSNEWDRRFSQPPNEIASEMLRLQAVDPALDYIVLTNPPPEESREPETPQVNRKSIGALLSTNKNH